MPRKALTLRGALKHSVLLNMLPYINEGKNYMRKSPLKLTVFFSFIVFFFLVCVIFNQLFQLSYFPIAHCLYENKLSFSTLMPSSHIPGCRKVHKAARSMKAGGGIQTQLCPFHQRIHPGITGQRALCFLGDQDRFPYDPIRSSIF